MEPADPPDVNTLNQHALNHVFGFLTIRERAGCERVCRRWRTLLLQLPVKAVRLSTLDQPLPLPISCDQPQHQLSRPNTLRVAERQLRPAVVGLFRKHRLLNTLCLQVHDIRALRRQEFFAFMRPFTAQLAHLELDFTYGPFVKEDLMHMIRSWSSTLLHLVIRYRRDRGKQLTEKSIMKLLEPCINLELICWDSPECVQQRFEYFPQRLTELRLPGNRLHPDSLEMLCESNGAGFLRLELGCTDAQRLRAICEEMRTLRYLAIGQIELQEPGEIDCLARLGELRVLELTIAGVELEWQLAQAVAGMGRLERLVLHEVSVGDQLLDVLRNSCPALSWLELVPLAEEPVELTDVGLEGLYGLARLRHVCLPFQRLSEPAVCRLLERPGLTSVDIRTALDYEETLVELMKDKARASPAEEFVLRLSRTTVECPAGVEALPANLQVHQAVRLVDESYEQFIQESYADDA